MATELIGSVLRGRYRVEAFLGRGGMAEVYRAFDTRRGRPVALKLLLPDLAEDPVFVHRFEREALALERLSHPNIVRFYGFEHDQSLAFIVMEYVDGVTLRRLISDQAGPMPLDDVLPILHQVCQVIDYAHGMGVIHRDIKPANIMIERSGRVVLADFGIARMAESATATGGHAGAPAFMSPEQCLGQELDGRTDIYSLGVTLYSMLTGGQRPFTGDTTSTTGSTTERIIWQHLYAAPPAPSQYVPALSPAVDAVVLKCLEKHRNDRYPNAQALFDALERASGRPGVIGPRSGKSAESHSPGEDDTLDRPLARAAEQAVDSVRRVGTAADEWLRLPGGRKGPLLRCPTCGQPAYAGDAICAHCGRPLVLSRSGPWLGPALAAGLSGVAALSLLFSLSSPAAFVVLLPIQAGLVLTIRGLWRQQQWAWPATIVIFAGAAGMCAIATMAGVALFVTLPGAALSAAALIAMLKTGAPSTWRR